MSTKTILIVVGVMLVIAIAMALVRRKPQRRGTGGLKVKRSTEEPKKRL